MDPSEIRFAVDRMLGRLARMLRLLGYDTYYANDMTQLLAMGRSGERMILTRGETARRFPHLDKVLSLKSEYPPPAAPRVSGTTWPGHPLGALDPLHVVQRAH